MEDLKILVAGHTAHGKSTLVRRLLCESSPLPQERVDRIEETPKKRVSTREPTLFTHRLENEETEALTTDTTRIMLRTGRRNYTFIETASQRELLKNIVTGAVKANAVILVIDASQGLLSQTCQHAYLTAMFGIEEIIVVVNKMDLKLYNRLRFWEISEETADFIKKLKLQIVAVIPVSAQYGDNITAKSDKMRWNTSPTLMKSLDYLSTRVNLTQLPLRFLVQSPAIAGGRATILGIVVSGTLFKGQKIIFGPVHHTTEVLSIRTSSQERGCAEPGESVALALDDVTNIRSGDVGFNVCDPPLTTNYLIADVFWTSTKPLKPADKINILCGTRRCPAQIEKIVKIINLTQPDLVCAHGDQLFESQAGTVRIKLDSPICIDPFDKNTELGKFTITDSGRIMGAGILK